VALVTRRYGPLVTLDPDDRSTVARLPDAVPGHALVVWAVAVRYAGFTATAVAPEGPALTIGPSGVHLSDTDRVRGGTLRTDAGARSLARLLEIACT
jgi:hypothetical protein